MGRLAAVPLRSWFPAAPTSRAAALGQRVVSTLLLLPIFLWIIMAGPLWLFGATIVIVAAGAQWEFTGMFERAGIRTFRLIGLIGGTILTSSFALPVSDRLVFFTLVLLGVLAAALYRPEGVAISWQPLVVTLFGICYINWLLGYAFWVRELDGGADWVLLLVWVTWLGETAAYVVGSLIGRRKLAPVISPKKTVEGATAQLVMSMAAAVAAQAWFLPALRPVDALVVGALLGVVGQVGDLVESALKRSVGTKDTGQLIPGHGGILDRIDSLLFNTPVLFYYALLGRILYS
jgi:phosphatidate cytidylyltransferase